MSSIWLPEIKKHRAAAERLKRKIDRADEGTLRQIIDDLVHHNREIRRLTSSRSKSK